VQSLIDLVNAYQDFGWLLLMLVVLYLRHKKVWVDGPTNQATEDRCEAIEAKLETYRAKLEAQAERNADQVASLTSILLEDRK
jgi:hypothetical protein